MKACIVPPNPGNLSAFGLLAVDWRTDHIVTKVMHEDAIDLAAVAQHLCRRWKRRRSRRSSATASMRARIRLVREADVRYAGQSMEVRVHRARRARSTRAFLAGLIDAFHAAHLQDLRLQLCRPAEGRAGQLLRLGLRPDRAAEHSRSSRRAAARRRTRKSSRPVYFDGAFRDTPVYERAHAAAGLRGRGSGGGRGVRLDHGRVPRPAPRGRPARHPDRPAGTQGSGGLHMKRMSSRARPTAPHATARGRPDRAADRRGHAQLDRGRDRIRHRAHRALAR